MHWNDDDHAVEPLALLAHEVMRRLAAVRVLTEAIQLTAGRGDDPRPLAERLAGEVGDLEQLGRHVLDAHRQERRDDADVLAIAAQAAETVRAGAPAVVRVEGAGPLWARTNAVLLRQALENLIENAHRHGGGTPVEVVVRRSSGGVEVLVMDRGPGMGKAGLRRDGNGLGLALVRRFVEETGSGMLTASRAGGGTVVRLELPAAGRQAVGSRANALATAESEREAG
ncbi:MAG TPA: HAMP domain-containing sensor histidine kinase [Actinomycetes bacterium]|jgi:two-component system sensor histidine kinase KdpD|nr:HAMP domain-containing sensor histidine kinase [Actinomycetes bacterium]